MATVSQWLSGARFRTLPAAISPVLAGTGAAFISQNWLPWGRAFLALVVALSLQIGVNYANDYSDGVRGTDFDRVGPMRLVGSGAAKPEQVKLAAFACFLIAALAGLALVLMTGHLWLLAVGVACIAAAWWYTGGKHPYGYAGFGEVFVFVFFGLVAVAGTTYVLVSEVSPVAWLVAVAMGALACAILVTNNLRDIDGDISFGKRTLATRLGDRHSRWFYVFLLAVAAFGIIGAAILASPWLLFGVAPLIGLIQPIRRLLAGESEQHLISLLKWTGVTQLMSAIGLFGGFYIMAVFG